MIHFRDFIFYFIFYIESRFYTLTKKGGVRVFRNLQNKIESNFVFLNSII
ncbi:hypothetical protein DCO58_00915 [Helicobacter saguini]|uniref:Uncharacterized protein n=1 Tax=Helicobacter saguini TaxID=1548018 RepID=A0A6B0HLI4_9HELI|nr:hypothetical protein [Helicobacter saguini]MWV63050.1 hypothetical protein [Helicobacter saguini]MWV66281.1 hypothetical protein [Helicobacter saguini]MWV68633.1 hypothetical protein [Helicobacter saguini]MWV71816.1 hypothetical protein [Helicobacter saguini]